MITSFTKGKEKVAEALIEAGVNVNSPDIDGATPLYMSVLSGTKQFILFVNENENVDLN